MASAKATGDRAMDLVMKYEAQNGRVPKRVDHEKKLGYDILSSGRKIEVKGADHGKVFNAFIVEGSQEVFKDPDFYFYRVLNVFHDNPTIVEIKPDAINLSKPRTVYNATSFKDKNRQKQFPT